MRDRGGEVLEGKYRLIRRIGAGGMGSVYLAEHVGIGKRVAVKVLHGEHASNDEAVRRFHQEARAAAAAGHRGIVDVHDIGVTGDGEPYLVMELLDGESLGTLLVREKPIPVRSAVDIALGALSALAAAHRRGVVHRDIKPDNIFLERTISDLPSVKLLDFGVSKMTQPGSLTTTRSGVALGTPHYMAPEQARGEVDLDARVDVYAMGVILYEALTAALPFDAPNCNAVMVRVMTDAPRPPRELRPDLPERLEEVILRAMAKDPANRFRRAEEMIEALLELTEADGADSRARLLYLGPPAAADEPEAPAPAPAHPSTPQTWTTDVPGVTTARSRGLVIAGGGAALLLLAGILWLARTDPPSSVVVAKWVPAAAPAAPPSPPTEPEAVPVTISLEGVPPGARVTLDDAVVPELPIRLPARDVMLRLKVEAEGYEPFSQMILPHGDRTIVVTMTRAATPSGPPARPAARRRTAPASAARPPVRPGPAPSSRPTTQLPPIVQPGPGPARRPAGQLPPIVQPGLPPIVSPGPPPIVSPRPR
ncbi:MAG: serine/threonine protein kinase [Deltaproteobacteria bacterium]|nr:serine/threonine protein kinase [Deltaproteobacteria bacterium]